MVWAFCMSTYRLATAECRDFFPHLRLPFPKVPRRVLHSCESHLGHDSGAGDCQVGCPLAVLAPVEDVQHQDGQQHLNGHQGNAGAVVDAYKNT